MTGILAGATGLEPATYGFGDRCATNCATPLEVAVYQTGDTLGPPYSAASFTLADRDPVSARLEVMGKIPVAMAGIEPATQRL